MAALGTTNSSEAKQRCLPSASFLFPSRHVVVCDAFAGLTCLVCDAEKKTIAEALLRALAQNIVLRALEGRWSRCLQPPAIYTVKVCDMLYASP